MPYAAKKSAWRDDEVARTYDARRFHGRLGRLKHGRDARLVLALLARAGGLGTVLDLPVGTGRLLGDLRRAGHPVLGADYARQMLAVARAAAPGTPLIQADGERLPLAADSVDAVVSVRFLFHVDDPAARRRILAEMARVARRAVVGEVRLRSTFKHVSRRLRRHARLAPAFDRAGLGAELAAAGLVLERLQPVSRVFSDKGFFVARPA